MCGFICPFCNKVMALDINTFQDRFISFSEQDSAYRVKEQFAAEDTIKVTFYKCPSCKKTTIKITGIGAEVPSQQLNFYPNSSAKQFPDYIPETIRNDYEESCSIVNLSPKASATLARRCLQGIIHDFWDIKLKNLNQEITALKDKIQPDLWNAIDGLRQLGNIGAHMEKDINTIVDIDSGEAETLIKLIELLMKEWYINREERNQLFSSILSINSEKQSQRKPKE